MVKKTRKIVNTAIENVRNKKLIGSSLETEIYIYIGDKKLRNIIESLDMKKILIISKFILLNNNKVKVENNLYEEKNVEGDFAVYVKKTNYLKCIRCWQYVEEIKNLGEICNRCKETLKNNV